MTTKGTPGDSLPRRPMASEDEQTWMDKENTACSFRDERLKKRVRLLLRQFWTSMGQSIPFACQDWASTKAAYRFFATIPPNQLWQSLTWDRGKELSDHVRFTVESGVKVFFAAPQSPWQRGTNENTNGHLRQYFPKGTDLSRWSAREIQAVANALNSRPRKTLGWQTPAETLDKYLKYVQQSNVATTG